MAVVSTPDQSEPQSFAGSRNIQQKTDQKRMYMVLAALMLLCVAIGVNLVLGTVRLPPGSLRLLFVQVERPGIELIVLRNIRLPRILTGLAVGANLAVAGALLQGVLRNPLASPHVIGVNAGAALFAVAVMVFFPSSISLISPAAFSGALLASVCVYLLSRRDSGQVTSIILAGVAISALLSAVTSGLMLVHIDDLDITYSWLVGGLSGRGWPQFRRLIPYSLLGLAAATVQSRRLNLFVLGDAPGTSLGLNPALERPVMLAIAAMLAGSAVSVAGTIGFIGLIAPHVARMLVGEDQRFMVPMSAIVGALLLMVSDLAARLMFQPYELPVGVVTAALGAPFFLYLLNRSGKYRA